MAKKRKLQHQPSGPRSGRPPLHQRQQPKKGSQKADGPSKAAPAQRHKQQHHQNQEPTIPFEPKDRILLFGEGDLSFAASITKHHGCTNVTATVLEKDAAELEEKYPHVKANIAIMRGEPEPEKEEKEANDDHVGDEEDKDEEEEDEGGEGEEEEEEEEDEGDEDTNGSNTGASRPNNNRIVYGIDATKPLPASVARPLYNRILFNFPHVGGKSTDVNRQVRYNQELLVGFFGRALAALAPGGSVVVTLFEGEPYTLWNVRDLARHAGLQVDRSFVFQPAAYPGYHHARTLGVIRGKDGSAAAGAWKGEQRSSRSYVFMRKGDVPQQTAKKKRGRDDDDSSDDDD